MKEEPRDGKSTDPENIIYKEFDDNINNFVKIKIAEYKPAPYNQNKVIHDPVWGTMLFYPWELQILDSPLLQRLRCINQVGLAVLTYPSARHSRFEHTLGVMSVVSKMVENINQEKNSYDDNDHRVISDKDLYKLRLAALLHDVGHCFFSHLSEKVYGKLKPFEKLKESFEIFKDAKEHEIFSYIIINTVSFKSFFQAKVNYPSKQDADDFFKDIGRMIVGAFFNAEKEGSFPERKYYMTQIINGQFDADKLDYLRRDSYTAGLALTYDIDRLLYKIRIEEYAEEIDGKRITGKHLVMPVSGISAIEEMAFSKLMLTSYIYQHQKVLATDELLLDIVEGLALNGKLVHPCDFLYYCDDDIYKICNNIDDDDDFKMNISNKIISSFSSKTLSMIVSNVKNRNLPKRALAINYNTVDNLGSSTGDKTKYKVADIAYHIEKLVTLRMDICNESNKISDTLTEKQGGKKQIDYYDIHISIPTASVAKDLANALVMTSEKVLVKLSDVVRLNDWADAFAYHKWNAYIYSRADIVPIVSIASKIVFERNGLTFNDKVFNNLKQREDIIKMHKVLNNEYDYFNIQKNS